MGELKDLIDLKKKSFDVVIVGGGIVGIGILRDLALHGINALLVEKGDFSSQTSQRSSKMLHGGIRYLENFDFHLVKEALHEKNLWLKLTPHLAKEKPFCLPIYKSSKYPLWMLRVGLEMYDYLSGYQNSPYSILNKQAVLEHFPLLNAEGLKGAGMYYDAIVDDARLALECLYDALYWGGENTTALNYTEVIEYKAGSTHQGAQLLLKDTLTGAIQPIEAKEVVFATGPFTDELFKRLKLPLWTDRLLLSKGIHLWLTLESLNLKSPMVLETQELNPKTGKKEARVFFAIPHQHALLIGTTETPLAKGEKIFNICAQEKDVDYLLRNLNHYFPKAQLTRKDVLSTFAGVRPLVREGNASDSLGKTSREHFVFRPDAHTHVIVGGKYTTFRKMAQDVARPVVQARGGCYSEFKTMRPLRKPSVVCSQNLGQLTRDDILQILQKEQVRTFADLIYRRLGVYGPRMWRESMNPKEFFGPLHKVLAPLITYSPGDWKEFQEGSKDLGRSSIDLLPRAQ